MPDDARAKRLDAIDLKILAALQRDGRMTKLKLADAVGLSPSPAHERVKRLEAAGYITGYRALIDVDRLVALSLVFVEVTLSRHAAEDFSRFEAAVRARPEILSCYALGGGVDYMLLIAAGDIAGYQRLVDALLAEDLGIERYFTYIVTKPVKVQDGWPLEALLPKGAGKR
ncbi:MAG: winged helix-turn-helix transcriptional regulator [Alphaproteobacteria bacterium]|nr:winged helix-turn-helix transcriptional regulator [Alphaproteobacteria bacterium]